ncbi:hypothetical protein B0H13DRAFT_2311262 [Mycena leptocephala]|nr:hypothetical protein B0H13DRAFT_2311262 [Mycena leptocephala]
MVSLHTLDIAVKDGVDILFVWFLSLAVPPRIKSLALLENVDDDIMMLLHLRLRCQPLASVVTVLSSIHACNLRPLGVELVLEWDEDLDKVPYTLIDEALSRPRSSFFPTSIIRALLDSLLSLDSLEKLQPVLHPWSFANGYRVRLYAVIHSLRTTINSERETERLERNAKQRATRQKKKKKKYLSESEDEMEDDGEDESDDQSSTDEEEDVHARSSPIPPSPKRQRRVLEEVTNTGKSTRPTAKKAARKTLQRAAEVSQSYSAPYKTSRRRAVQN